MIGADFLQVATAKVTGRNADGTAPTAWAVVPPRA